MVHLSALTHLKALKVAYSLAGDGSMAALGELTQLQHLDLDSCPITNTYATCLACSIFAAVHLAAVCVSQSSFWLVPDNCLSACVISASTISL